MDISYGTEFYIIMNSNIVLLLQLLLHITFPHILISIH
jgi:hypothetical protein